jgi:hypothetical protein
MDFMPLPGETRIAGPARLRLKAPLVEDDDGLAKNLHISILYVARRAIVFT